MNIWHLLLGAFKIAPAGSGKGGGLVPPTPTPKPPALPAPVAPAAVAPAPPWVVHMLTKLGWHEKRNNAQLTAWLKSDGKALGDPTKFPWCGDAVETAIKLTVPKVSFTKELLQNPYWARNWSQFGVSASHIPYGAIVSFERQGGGGHVGFAVGKSKDGQLIYVLGGNQTDSITIAPLAATRLLAARWPKEVPMSNAPLPIRVGGALSVNEV